MRVRVLGSTAVEGPEGPVALAARRPRSILAALALSPGTTTSADRLVDLVWGDDAPAGAHGTLHAYISGLRRVLEPELAPRARPTVLVTTDDGYRLDIDPSEVDALAFAREVRARHGALAPLWSQLSTGPEPTWPSREEVVAHVEALEEALRTWSGAAYADLGDHPDVLADRAALDELRATAEEDTALGLLALGEHAAVLAATEQAGARHPLRERTRSLQALALVRTGRHVEALEVLRAYREHLADELGLDPGPEVRALEEAVLRQDPALGTWLRPTARPRVPTAPAPTAVGAWGTVGRDAERAVVADVLTATAGGGTGAVLVIGDPGTGKTRLVDDAVATARDLGMVTAVGRCSQDDGAPPLWPWFALLDGLDLDRPAELDQRDDDGDPAGAERAFAVQDALARAVRRRSRADPVLLVVEDLHWADTRTLRALVHLVSSLGPGDRVALIATRRARPQPTGALADLGVALARHGARTVELGGLGLDDARALVAAVAGADEAGAGVDVWWTSTGGNPFFLVELARLAASGGGWRGEVPESVQTVVTRRLDDLPEATRDVLLVAAALGREHSPLLLAHVGGWAPGEVADRLEPAEDAGVVHQRADGRLAFEHALTRDAVLAAVSPARVARVHARIAHALGSMPRGALGAAERAFDLAHHWLAAGPVHAPQAWRAAAAAATEARREFANVEAAELYRAALDAHALDPTATREERYHLLLDFAEAAAWAARWRPVVEAVIEAVALARADDDRTRMAQAATSLTRYSAWLPQEHEEVHEDLVDDLRWGLRGLDHHDSATRCILMLALAVQLYYRPGSEPETEALVEEGLGVARRLGDPGLRAWAARSGWLALWRVEHLDARRALAHEELEAALASGDEAAVALAHVGLAGTALEDGDREAWLEHSAAADDIARRRRLTYVEFVLHFVRLSLSVMEGDTAAAADHADAMRTLGEQTATPAKEWTEFGITYLLALWDRETRQAVLPPMLEYFARTPDDFVRSPVLQLLAVDGRVDELRTELDRAPLVPIVDNWYVLSEAAGRIEAAALVGDTEVAREAVAVLRRAEGRFVVSGISTVYGPVDGYLALGHALLGEPDRATALADAAEALATRWEETTYLAWLAERRRRHGF